MAKQSTNLTTPNLLNLTEDNVIQADEFTMEIYHDEFIDGPLRTVSTRHTLAEWGGLYYLVE